MKRKYVSDLHRTIGGLPTCLSFFLSFSLFLFFSSLFLSTHHLSTRGENTFLIKEQILHKLLLNFILNWWKEEERSKTIIDRKLCQKMYDSKSRFSSSSCMQTETHGFPVVSVIAVPVPRILPSSVDTVSMEARLLDSLIADNDEDDDSKEEENMDEDEDTFLATEDDEEEDEETD